MIGLRCLFRGAGWACELRPPPAQHAPAAAVRDLAELLDVHVHQFAGTLAFVATHHAR